jgi:hypothetical protein
MPYAKQKRFQNQDPKNEILEAPRDDLPRTELFPEGRNGEIAITVITPV